MAQRHTFIQQQCKRETEEHRIPLLQKHLFRYKPFMRAIPLLVCVFVFACHSGRSDSSQDTEKFRDETVYADSSILGKVYNGSWEIPVFKGFTAVSGGNLPAGHELLYHVSQIKKEEDSYVLLIRYLKPGAFPHKLLDTLHIPNFDPDRYTFSYWYCNRNKKYGEGAFVGLFLKSEEKQLTQAVRAWEVDMRKGVFVATSPAGISCENTAYEY